MTDMSEIDDIVARASKATQDVDDDDDGDDGGEDTPSPEKRRRTSRKMRPVKAKEPPTVEELELQEQAASLLPMHLPKPAQEVKGLDDMYVKYGVGESPDFHIEVWRTYPKLAPGGVKFDGFYDTWQEPIGLEQIQAEYGGGTYRIAVMGPNPTNPRRKKQYDSLSISLAGNPKYERMPRSMMGGAEAQKVSDTIAGNPMPLPIVQQDSPKVVESALKMMKETADGEREERRRIEDRAEQRGERLQEMLNPVIDAERRRSDDVLAAERRAAEQRDRLMQERLDEERRAREEERREVRRKLELMEQRPQRSVADELATLAQSGLFSRDDGGAAKEMLSQILEKHRGEMEAMTRQQTTFVESLRSGHASELLAIRDAHRKEMEAEREASRAREARIDERLQSEREERRRDQERYREQIESRDTQWRDRMDQALETMKSSWESRHQSATAMFEQRLQWVQQENDRLRSEMSDMKLKTEEKGDLFAQLSKYRDLSTTIKEMSGVSESPPSGVGIGLSGTSAKDEVPAWVQMIAESPVAERVVDGLLGGMGMGGAVAAQAAPQQQFQEGQVVETPQGVMVVIRDPASGQLMLTPKAAFEQAQRQAQQQAARGGGGGRPGLPSRTSQRPRQSRRSVSVVPNLGEGLPRRRAPWEGGGEEPEARRPAPPPQSPLAAVRPAAPPPPDAEPLQLNQMERQGLNMIAQMVHESVQAADDSDEFVAKVMNKYSVDVLKQIVLPYSVEDVVRGIYQVQPTSAGATPAGQQFVRDAFRKLRHALTNG